MKYRVPFHFKQTGVVFVMNGKTYHIERKLQQSQAAKAGIDYDGGPLASPGAVQAARRNGLRNGVGSGLE